MYPVARILCALKFRHARGRDPQPRRFGGSETELFRHFCKFDSPSRLEAPFDVHGRGSHSVTEIRVVPYENQQIGSWQIGDSKGLKWRTAPSLCAKVYVGTPQFFTTHQLATIVGTRL